MTAVAPTKSDQYLLFSPTTPPPALTAAASLECEFGAVTFTTAGTGTIKMVRLPAGKLRILVDQSWVYCPQGTASADLHVGYAAYQKMDGTAGTADDNAFADNLDVGGGAIDQAFALPAAGYFDIETATGLDIELMIDTANSPGSGEAFVYVIFQKLSK